MIERIKELFKTKNRKNLENLYELVYEVEVKKNNLIVDLDKQISDLKYQVMELENKVNAYKQKIKEMREENGN